MNKTISSTAATRRHRLLGFFLLALGPVMLTGCEDTPLIGRGHEFGANDDNTIAVMGDSISNGGFSSGPSWPSRLAALSGLNVDNRSVPGSTTEDGLSNLGAVLQGRPGYVIIALGANDAIQSVDPAAAAGNIESMVTAIRENGSIPVVANVMPMSGGRQIYNGNVDAINTRLEEMAMRRRVNLVNLNDAIGSNPDLFLVDGLHPSDAGENLIALEFSGLF